MKQELLDIIKPQIQAKAEDIYHRFEERAEEERQACGEPCGDRQTDEWIDGALDAADFFWQCLVEFDGDTQELIDNDSGLQAECNKLVYNIVTGNVR